MQYKLGNDFFYPSCFAWHKTNSYHIFTNNCFGFIKPEFCDHMVNLQVNSGNYYY